MAHLNYFTTCTACKDIYFERVRVECLDGEVFQGNTRCPNHTEDTSHLHFFKEFPINGMSASRSNTADEFDNNGKMDVDTEKEANEEKNAEEVAQNKADGSRGSKVTLGVRITW
eukprot:CAMPEP_0194444856 /NCGR_PEP_ID=MMETSP0176-20130528/127524_1 /TAXON_ID=216777 /ORGANISM="Proboscia alata, Strain PI-D3" /LENGTH=113 /DNA_ID=CAMNT_0039271317 /DNA_START=20 /DNA_END=358 /DNA_ORIENTATION=-